MPEDLQENDNTSPSEPSSHVKAAPESMPGHDYDPRLRVQYANEPKVVHATRDIEVKPKQLSDETRRRCEESRRNYPQLSLSDGEYVILEIQRHPIGLLFPIAATALILIAILMVLIFYPSGTQASTFGLPDYSLILIPAMIFMVIVGIGGFAAVWVYLQNRFLLTNESIVQEIQLSLFARHEQIVSLGSIEDASFKRSGIVQTMFNYGTLRLSTEGDETTYRFSYVANPHKQVSIVNNAIEAFKNGRPVDPYEN